MKKCITLFLLIGMLCTIAGCNRASSQEKLFAKAQSVYNKKGFEAFVAYTDTNGYFPVIDEVQNKATPLLTAIQRKDRNAVMLFLEKGASLAETDANGLDTVAYALQHFDEVIMHRIITDMPDGYWQIKDAGGKTHCMTMISNCNHYESVKEVISRAGNVNAADSKGKTLLMYAAQYNTDVRAVKFLLDQYVNPDTKNTNQWTAVMYAARYNPNPLVLEDLLVRGASTAPNAAGLTVTMLAACNPNPGVLLTLLKYMGEVNAQTDRGKTALMYACENNQAPAAVKLLIDRQADVNLTDSDGKTALMYALEHNTMPETAYLLLTAGADCRLTDNAGKSVKDYLAKNSALKNTELAHAIEVKVNGTASDMQQAGPPSDEAAVDGITEEQNTPTDTTNDAAEAVLQSAVPESAESNTAADKTDSE